jgi:H+/Cl- antiporter ClcA
VIGLVAGAFAFLFIIYVKSLKWLVHRVHLDNFPLLLSLLGASLVGLCGVLSPAALFWGEHELQWAVQMVWLAFIAVWIFRFSW